MYYNAIMSTLLIRVLISQTEPTPEEGGKKKLKSKKSTPPAKVAKPYAKKKVICSSVESGNDVRAFYHDRLPISRHIGGSGELV